MESTPKKSNIPNMALLLKESAFPRPIILGIHSLVFRDVRAGWPLHDQQPRNLGVEPADADGAMISWSTVKPTPNVPPFS